ncbi:hypothetical protein [Ammoniphilus resinae]|uniref:Uncharacterized protein n=1 Tax=Ammoniphilus resinae TaxID=861532 RepID=A0ABS4GRL0_9BACL|nr:hypothetical protein [Ammoniphilus resinae]MBP1932908.1 hypothetical protein [Ammoniphilus resinae]
MKDKTGSRSDRKVLHRVMKDKSWSGSGRKVLHRAYEGQILVGIQSKSPSSSL